MELQGQRILLTGASGGIGRALEQELTARGALRCHLQRAHGTESNDVLLVNGDPAILRCDLLSPADIEAASRLLEREWGGVDILINLAGTLDFTAFSEQDPARLQQILQLNLAAPMQLARAVLPGMLARGSGRIVNVGSMFGSIGFPCFATYSATKFALRGFSQALRRELEGSGVGVGYVSPRAVKTALNPPVVHAMAARGMMNMDAPEPVALAIVRAIEEERDELYFGFPESLFARINAILPGIVDRALRRQVPAMLALAREPAGR